MLGIDSPPNSSPWSRRNLVVPVRYGWSNHPTLVTRVQAIYRLHLCIGECPQYRSILVSDLLSYREEKDSDIPPFLSLEVQHLFKLSGFVERDMSTWHFQR